MFLSFYFCFFVICAGIKSAAAAHAANFGEENTAALKKPDTKQASLFFGQKYWSDRWASPGEVWHVIIAITFNKLEIS